MIVQLVIDQIIRIHTEKSIRLKLKLYVTLMTLVFSNFRKACPIYCATVSNLVLCKPFLYFAIFSDVSEFFDSHGMLCLTNPRWI